MSSAALVVALIATALAATSLPSRAAIDPSDFDGRTVLLVNVATGLFLDGDNNGAVNQSRVPGDDDRWLIEQVGNDIFTLTNQDLGALLDADEKKRGYDVDLSRSARSDTHWRLVHRDDGTYNVQNAEYDLWLDADFADERYNVDLTANPDEADARWYIALGDTSPDDLPGSTVLIVNAATGRFLDGDLHTVDQSVVPKHDDIWQIDRQANGTATVQNTDKQLFLHGDRHDVDLAKADTPGIEWELALRPDGALQIRNAQIGQWLDADYERQGYNVDLTVNGKDFDAGWYVIVLRRVVDEDGDGFEGFNGDNRDCDDSDVAINPNAGEIPGNDVDENCDGIVQPEPTATPTTSPVLTPTTTPTTTPDPGATPTVTPQPGTTPTVTPEAGITPTVTPTTPPNAPVLDIIFVPGVPPFQCQGNDVPTETFATIINFFPNEPVQVFWSAPGRAEELISERPANSAGDRTLGWRCELGGTITFRALGTQSGATLTFDLVTLPSEVCQPEPIIVELPFDAAEKVTRPITATTTFGQRDAGCAPISVAFSAGDLVWVTGETATFYRVRRLNDVEPIFIEKDAIAFEERPGPVAAVDAAKINACANSRRDFTARFITIYLANDQLRGDDSSNPLAFVTNLAAFRNLVGTGNELDIKSNEPALIEARDNKCGVRFFGRTVQADVPGNVLYGMIGYRYFYETQRLGRDSVLTTSLLVGAAGLAQQGGPIDNLLDDGDWARLAVGDPACDTYAVETGALFERSANGGELVTRSRAQIETDMTSQLGRINTYLYDVDSWCLGGNEQFYPEFGCSGRGHPYGTQLDPIRVC